MRIDQAELRLRGLAREVQRKVNRAEMESARKGVQLAKYFSSGKLKMGKGKLSKLHPYARRHGQPLADPGIINRQSGIFQRSWRIDQRGTAFGPSIPVIHNIASYAHFLETGTKYMFARPIKEKIEAALQPIRLQNLKRALSELETNWK